MDIDVSRERPDWSEIEEATPLFTGSKVKKPSVANVTRWRSVANAVVVALIVTMPAILFIVNGRLHLDEPAVWIKSTVAGLGARQGNCNL